MALFGSRKRKELEAARSKISDWCEVHDAGGNSELADRCRGLRDEADDLLKSYFLDDHAANRLIGRIARLESFFDDLVSFNQRVERSRLELARLREEISGELIIARELDVSCRELVTRLDRFTLMVSDGSRLDECTAGVERIERVVHLLDQAVQIVRRADKVNNRAEGLDHPDAIGLRGELPLKIRELATLGEKNEEDVDAWIAQIRARVEVLERQLRDVPDDTPNALLEASENLETCIDWSDLLERDKDDLLALKERVGLHDGGWRKLRFHDDKVASLSVQVAQKLEALAEDARQRRTSYLEEFEYSLTTFAQVSQGRLDLRGDLHSLREDHHAVRRPYDHERWMTAFRKAEQAFWGHAASMQTDLERRKAREKEARSHQLQEVAQLPLSDSVRDKLEGMRKELAGLDRPLQAEALLQTLLRLHKMKREVAELNERARREVQSVEQQEGQLASRRELLLRLSVELGLPVDDLGETPEPPGPSGQTLDEAQRAAQALATRLDRAEEDFIAACRHIHDELGSYDERATDVLNRFRHPRPDAGPLEALATDVALSEVAEQVSRARAYRARLDDHLRAAERALSETFKTYSASLAQISPGRLHRDLRDEHDALRSALRECEWSAEDELLVRLESMANVVDEYDYFQEQLQYERTKARQIRQHIEQQLETVKRLGLRRYSDPRFERIVELLHGVAVDPPDWGPVLAQLQLCKDQLALVVPHCRRRAAEEVRAGLVRLRDQRRARRGDTQWLARAADVERTLQRIEPGRLPDNHLRRKLLQLVPNNKRRR